MKLIIIMAIVAAVAAFAEPFKVLGYTFGEQPAADAPTSHRWCERIDAEANEHGVYVVECETSDVDAWVSRLTHRYGEPDSEGPSVWCLDNGAIVEVWDLIETEHLEASKKVRMLYHDDSCPFAGSKVDILKHALKLHKRKQAERRRVVAEDERAGDEDF